MKTLTVFRYFGTFSRMSSSSFSFVVWDFRHFRFWSDEASRRCRRHRRRPDSTLLTDSWHLVLVLWHRSDHIAHIRWPSFVATSHNSLLHIVSYLYGAGSLPLAVTFPLLSMQTDCFFFPCHSHQWFTFLFLLSRTKTVKKRKKKLVWPDFCFEPSLWIWISWILTRKQGENRNHLKHIYKLLVYRSIQALSKYQRLTFAKPVWTCDTRNWSTRKKHRTRKGRRKI